MLRAMAVPSILEAVIRGEVLEKSRRRVSDDGGGQKILGRGGVACGKRNLHIRRSLILILYGYTSSQRLDSHERAARAVGDHVIVSIHTASDSTRRLSLGQILLAQ